MFRLLSHVAYPAMSQGKLNHGTPQEERMHPTIGGAVVVVVRMFVLEDCRVVTGTSPDETTVLGPAGR